MGPDGKFLWVAPSCKRVTGYSAEEFIQDAALFHNIIYPDDRDMMMRHTSDSLRHEQEMSFSLDFRIVRRDGEIRWINHVCQPVHADDKKLAWQAGFESGYYGAQTNGGGAQGRRGEVPLYLRKLPS